MKQNLFVHGGSALVSKVTCDGSLRESIERSVELIGGLDRLVKRGDTILLKPNYNTADPFPGSNDPEFVKAVIEMLYEAGAEKVILGERTAFLHSRRVLERAGIVKMAEEAGAEVRVFGKDGWNALFDMQGWRRIGVPGGQYLRRVALARGALDIQKIVYIPLIKTHHAADFTGSIKLSMGFVKPFFVQMAFHLRHLH